MNIDLKPYRLGDVRNHWLSRPRASPLVTPRFGKPRSTAPLLLTVFGLAALAAVVVHKAMSLVVVVAAIPARLTAVPLSRVADDWTAAANLLAGSLLGAWLGASWATRIASATLYRVLAVLLISIAVLFTADRVGTIPPPDLTQLVAGVVAASTSACGGRAARRCWR